MAKKPRMLLRKGRKPYWGILAQDTSYKKFLEPVNFAGLLQAQVQIAEDNPVSAPDRVPGKDYPDRPSEDIPV